MQINSNPPSTHQKTEGSKYVDDSKITREEHVLRSFDRGLDSNEAMEFQDYAKRLTSHHSIEQELLLTENSVKDNQARAKSNDFQKSISNANTKKKDGSSKTNVIKANNNVEGFYVRSQHDNKSTLNLQNNGTNEIIKSNESKISARESAIKNASDFSMPKSKTEIKGRYYFN